MAPQTSRWHAVMLIKTCTTFQYKDRLPRDWDSHYKSNLVLRPVFNLSRCYKNKWESVHIVTFLSDIRIPIIKISWSWDHVMIVFPGIEIPLVRISQTRFHIVTIFTCMRIHNHLIFIIDIPIPIKQHLCIDSSPLSDAYMRQWTGSALV